MIDFNNGEEKLNKFLGSEKKTTILYYDKLYMIKFPDPVRDRKNILSYINNQFSEYIGCNIFKSCGFEVQKTELGYYTDKRGIKKIVVGCEDFTQDGSTLFEFTKLCNSIIEIDKKLGTTIENVHLVIKNNELIKEKSEIINGFWDMFVIDALIGNADRHFDNWGIIEKNGEIKFAPIYDCGSTLGALLDDEKMKGLLKNPVEFKNEEYNIKSCYSLDGKRIFYHKIFKNPPKPLLEAIKRTVPKIDMYKIYTIVDSVMQISEVRKEYLKQALNIRYVRILAPSLKLIKE